MSLHLDHDRHRIDAGYDINGRPVLRPLHVRNLRVDGTIIGRIVRGRDYFAVERFIDGFFIEFARVDTFDEAYLAVLGARRHGIL